jgi:hypothetical protein
MRETGAMRRLKPFFPGAKWTRIDGWQNPGAVNTHVSYEGRAAFCELKHVLIPVRTACRPRWNLPKRQYAWIMERAESGACVRLAIRVTQWSAELAGFLCQAARCAGDRGSMAWSHSGAVAGTFARAGDAFRLARLRVALVAYGFPRSGFLFFSDPTCLASKIRI